MTILKFILNAELNLYEKNEIAYCDSLQIAETFERRHTHVIETIENLSKSIGKKNKVVVGIQEENLAKEIQKIINGGEVIG